MLLIQDDKPWLQRQKEAGPGADDNAGRCLTGQLHERPETLTRAQVAVKETQIGLRQGFAHIVVQLQGDSHFRGQQHDMAAMAERTFGQLKVDRRLAAARHAEKQRRLRCLSRKEFPEPVHGLRLIRCQAERGLGIGASLIGRKLRFHLSHQSLAQQDTQGLGNILAAMRAQSLGGRNPVHIQITQHLKLGGGLRAYRPRRFGRLPTGGRVLAIPNSIR